MADNISSSPTLNYLVCYQVCLRGITLARVSEFLPDFNMAKTYTHTLSEVPERPAHLRLLSVFTVLLQNSDLKIYVKVTVQNQWIP